MRGIAVKVYASFYPLAPAEAEALGDALDGLAPLVMGDASAVFREGDMVRISYEGLYYPVDDALDVLERLLPATAQGRLDFIDMEGWTITRHVYAGGKRTGNIRNLNDVLDHSGH